MLQDSNGNHKLTIKPWLRDRMRDGRPAPIATFRVTSKAEFEELTGPTNLSRRKRTCTLMEGWFEESKDLSAASQAGLDPLSNVHLHFEKGSDGRKPRCPCKNF